MQTISNSRLIIGFATILVFAVIGGSIGYLAGIFVSEMLAATLSFAGVMAGLVVGSVYFVRKIFQRDPLAADHPIAEANDELFDGDYVLIYENATDSYKWISRAEWNKREKDIPADDDDG